MAFSRIERFALKRRIIEEIDNDGAWDLRRQNLLLSEFGLQVVTSGWQGPNFEDVIAKITDHDLVEMCSAVTGVTQDKVVGSVKVTDAGNWKPGYVRLFLSHSSEQEEFVGEVAEELAVVGIHGFVAHDSMQYSKPWQDQIEHALRSMEAFVAFVHPDFEESAWCNQEVGWAMGRAVPKYIIRMGSEPAGFVGRDQWPSGNSSSPRELASLICKWASSIQELGEAMANGLFASLEAANNYIDAGATASRIANLSGLTGEQWERLGRIYWSNDQLYYGALTAKALQPFYDLHEQEWPPKKP